MVNILIAEIYPLNMKNLVVKKSELSKNGSYMPESKNKIRKLQTLYGNALLHYGLKQLYNLEEGRFDVKYGKNGKPYLENQRHIYFNISHSSKYVACAISDCEIGIDIQGLLNWKEEKVIDIAENFFSEDELNTMIKSEDKRDLFFNLWVLKESYIKYRGGSLRLPMDYIEFNINNNDITFIDKEDVNVSPYFKIVNIGSEYRMAICTNEESDFLLKKIDYIEILNLLR